MVLPQPFLPTIPTLSFVGLNTSGNLKVGNYIFYFKLSDSDGNETDFVAESGVVTCYIGNLNDPSSIQGGIRDENSYKSVSFILSNIAFGGIDNACVAALGAVLGHNFPLYYGL